MVAYASWHAFHSNGVRLNKQLRSPARGFKGLDETESVESGFKSQDHRRIPQRCGGVQARLALPRHGQGVADRRARAGALTRSLKYRYNTLQPSNRMQAQRRPRAATASCTPQGGLL